MSFQDLESGRRVAPRRGFVNGKQDPTQAVASGIFQINTAVSTFQRFVNTLGTPKDTPELREKLEAMTVIKRKRAREEQARASGSGSGLSSEEVLKAVCDASDAYYQGEQIKNEVLRAELRANQEQVLEELRVGQMRAQEEQNVRLRELEDFNKSQWEIMFELDGQRSKNNKLDLVLKNQQKMLEMFSEIFGVDLDEDKEDEEEDDSSDDEQKVGDDNESVDEDVSAEENAGEEKDSVYIEVESESDSEDDVSGFELRNKAREDEAPQEEVAREPGEIVDAASAAIATVVMDIDAAVVDPVDSRLSDPELFIQQPPGLTDEELDAQLQQGIKDIYEADKAARAAAAEESSRAAEGDA